MYFLKTSMPILMLLKAGNSSIRIDIDLKTVTGKLKSIRYHKVKQFIPSFQNIGKLGMMVHAINLSTGEAEQV